MNKTFKCKDMDPEFVDCTFKVTSEDEVEMMDLIKEHLMAVHAFEDEEIDADMEEKIFATIKDIEQEDPFENEDE